MTNDDFTEVAQAEAERRWPRVARRNKTAEEWLDEGMGSGFVLGAQWGRDQTLAQMKQKVAAAHQERNKALAQARKAEELLRNVGEHLAEQETTDDALPENVANLIRDLIDPDDCWFDHHGGCQAHGYLDLTPEEECPHSEAKRLLATRRDEEER